MNNSEFILETPDSNEPENLTDWDDLANPTDDSNGQEDLEELADDERDDVYEKTLNRAKLYRRFGQITLALTNYEDSLSRSDDKKFSDNVLDTTPENINLKESEQAEALIAQLEMALGELDRSLENQVDYDIINHKQINTREALEEELQSGSGIPELDIRFDKDGKPWISHSPRAGARFLFSKPIHTLSSNEVAEIGQRLSLEDGLSIIKQYKEDNANHKIVLELKELGNSEESKREYLENIKVLLEETGLTKSAIFATLSPDILRATHDIFPENSKILNGGIAPVISYDLAKKTLGEDSNKEFVVKIPGVELFFSNSSEIKEHNDGYGKQTGYLWTRLPKETVSALKKLNENGKIGAASLTIVNKFANILDRISPKTAKALREHYAGQLDELGLRKQVAISKTDPLESLLRTKAQMGQDSIIYSDTSPGNWAVDLPPRKKIE